VPASLGSARRAISHPGGDSLAPKHGCIGSVEGGAGFEIAKHLIEAGAPNSIRQAVMQLREHSHAAILEALDEPDLPQGATRLELLGQQIADQRTELAGATRGRDADGTDLAVEIEVQVAHPSGAVEAKGNLDQAAQERAEQPRSGLDQRAQPLHIETVRGGRGAVEGSSTASVPRCMCELGVSPYTKLASAPLSRCIETPPVPQTILLRC
jgi:hypothetical protein